MTVKSALMNKLRVQRPEFSMVELVQSFPEFSYREVAEALKELEEDQIVEFIKHKWRATGA